MTLLDLSEPLLQYVCCLNRAAQRGVAVDFANTQTFVQTLLSEIKKTAAKDFRLAQLFNRVELPLLFFVDSMISESTLLLAGQWTRRRLAYQKDELAGDEKFFDLLEETLQDPSNDATDCLMVYHACLGLGFTGIYASRPEILKDKITRLQARLSLDLPPENEAKLFPDTYEHTDERDLLRPANHKLVIAAACFVLFTLAALFLNIYSFNDASAELKQTLSQIIAHSAAE